MRPPRVIALGQALGLFRGAPLDILTGDKAGELSEGDTPMSKKDTMSYYTKDANGDRAARGLTATETEELESLWRDKSARGDFDKARFLQLFTRHEAALVHR
jgi:hypothetical protein